MSFQLIEFRRILSRIALLSIVLALVPEPKQAHAAACCTSATAFGTGRLLIWETFAVGLNTSFVSTLGDFEKRVGHWQFHGADYGQNQWRTEAWGIVGITNRASLFTLIPWVVPTETSSGDMQYGYGFGDIQAGARYQLLNIGEYAELPSFALIGTLILPTGRSIGGPSEVTGRGVWGAAIGTSLEKTWMPWYVQLNLGATLPLSANERHVMYGPSAQVGLAGGLELPKEIVVSLIGQWSYEGEWYETIANNTLRQAGYKTSITLAGSWRFHPHFTLQTSLSSDVFIEPISYGLPGNIAFNVGIRYGYF